MASKRKRRSPRVTPRSAAPKRKPKTPPSAGPSPSARLLPRANRPAVFGRSEN